MNILYKKDLTKEIFDREAQMKINNKLEPTDLMRYANYIDYNLDRNDNELNTAVFELLEKNSRYLDKELEDFISSFPGNYTQSIFELVMIDAFEKKFNLIPRENRINFESAKDVDCVFLSEERVYFLECTSIKSLQLDGFYKLLPWFEMYFSISKILFLASSRLSIMYKNRCSEWYDIVHLLWYDLTEIERKYILEIFESHNVNIKFIGEIFEKINHWIYIHRYICHSRFKNLIEPALLDLLISIDFPVGRKSIETRHYISSRKLLLERISERIVDKIGKQYFHGKIPVVLAISLATFDDIVYLGPADHLVEYITVHLMGVLKQLILSKENSCELAKKLKYIYAILLDTTWYNWLKNICISRHGAIFRSGYNNYYAVIYNADLSERFQEYIDTRDLDSIVQYTFTLPISVTVSETVIKS